MSNLKKTAVMLILSGNMGLLMAVPMGTTAFSITPSTSSITVSSTAESNVLYRVTNNTTVSVPTISVTPGYNSTGSALSLSDDDCTGTTLGAGLYCTFRVLIPVGQSSSFTLTPKVCGFKGFLCSKSSTTVNVNVVMDALPVRAYEEVSDTSNGMTAGTTTLIGIDVADTSNVISNIGTAFGYSTAPNGVAVSKDGTRVYATAIVPDSLGDVFLAVNIFEVESDKLTLLNTVVLPTFPNSFGVGSNTIYAMELALTPDGSTLFVTLNTGGPSMKNPVHLGIPPHSFYRIDNVNTDHPIASAITDAHNLAAAPGGVVVSPDGQTVYVATGDVAYILAFPVSATSITSADEISGTIADLHPGLAIDPAGTTLYLGNEACNSVSEVALNANNAVTTPLTDSITGPQGITVSSDGSHVFIANSDNTVLSITPDASPGTLQPTIDGAFGLGISPDGTHLYVSQFGDSPSNMTTILNPIVFLAPRTTVMINGSSNTIGNFVG